MKKTAVFVLFIIGAIFCVQNGYAQNVYYVATGGNDTNPGTFEQPFATLRQAIIVSVPGDTTYIRGGVYYLDNGPYGINPDAHPSPIGMSGTSEAPIHYYNYPGEMPVFDGVNQVRHSPTGIHMHKVQYIKWRGITIRNIFQNREHNDPREIAHGFRATEVANITYERITVHDINGRAWWQSSGAWKEWDGWGGMEDPIEPGMWAYDTTRWINCDAYNLFDSLSSSPGNAADGWKTISYSNCVYMWDGCRAWHYSDDGLDPSGNMTNFHVHNSWFMATDKYAGLYPEWNIEANGIKFAAPRNIRYFPDLMDDTIGVRIVNCIAVFNRTGIINNLLYGANSSWSNARVYNNLAYHNGIHFHEGTYHPDLKSIWNTSVYKNNLAHKATYAQQGFDPIYFVQAYRQLYVNENNTWVPTGGWPGWVYNTDFTLEDAAFTSVDSMIIINEMTAPRKADGSLPDLTWPRLVADSDMKGAGSYVGMSANPDIGVDWAWLDAGGGVPLSQASKSLLSRSSPAFTFSTTRDAIVIEPGASQRGRVEVALYDGRGRRVSLLHGAGGESLRIETKAFAPGVYTIQIRTDGQSHTRRVVVSRQGRVGL